MFDLSNNLTVAALERFGDAASKRFYNSLKEKIFETTKCGGCGSVFFPPRAVCRRCGSENVGWVELSGEGTVYAFTQQVKPLRFPKPDVVGIIELVEGGEAVGRLLAKIDAPFENVRIGAPVKVDYLELSKKLVMPRFKLNL